MLRRRCAGALTRLTVDTLVEPLRERLNDLKQGGDGGLVARYRRLTSRLEQLQRESARWQTMLSDEVADLTADLDYDLRDRTRRILREADEYFEVADPAKDWPEFEEWLRENLRAAAEVVKYLESVGDADRRPTSQPIGAAERDRLVELLLPDLRERSALLHRAAVEAVDLQEREDVDDARRRENDFVRSGPEVGRRRTVPGRDRRAQGRGHGRRPPAEESRRTPQSHRRRPHPT